MGESVRHGLLFLVVPALIGAWGCSNRGEVSGGQGTPTPTGTQTPLPTPVGSLTLYNVGGSVDLNVSANNPYEKTSGMASFVALTPQPTPFTLTWGDGHCVVFGTSASSVSGSSQSLDAGGSVSFVHGTASLLAAKDTSGGYVQYTYPPPPAISSPGLTPGQMGVTWNVVAAGGPDIPAGVIGAIRMPRQVQGVSLPAAVSGQPATVSWTPGSGGDTIGVGMMNTSTGAGFACYPADSWGSFTVPANLIALVSGPGALPLYLEAETFDKATVHGRDILLEGACGP